ncbi:acetyltransferase [Nitrosomonas sp.]|uniref:acetyltransferase n=1 Tax=Nitrosomonas sp. TaxID=42353 RepID=UPI001DD55F57|nr:acetyltransferase [Nitrosomonas sp.]MCB1949763.1 acetyltransferase [Nitrosomonas sp.]
MAKTNVVVFGASGHARVVCDVIRKQGDFNLLGLVDKATDQIGNLGEYPILGRDDELPSLMRKYDVSCGIIGIGDNWLRAQVANRILSMAPDFKFISAIHPSAQIGQYVKIAPGTTIMANVVLNCSSVTGRHTIINTSSSLDHDCVLGDFASIAPGCTVGGSVEIGHYSFIGLGANIVHNIHIGDFTVVGAGSTVLNDLPDQSVAYGTPAKVVRKYQQGERYL